MTTEMETPTPEEWRLRVEQELGPDRSFERTLITRTLEGIDIEPLHVGPGDASTEAAGEVSPRGGGPPGRFWVSIYIGNISESSKRVYIKRRCLRARV